jgi:hypothetical protein
MRTGVAEQTGTVKTFQASGGMFHERCNALRLSNLENRSQCSGRPEMDLRRLMCRGESVSRSRVDCIPGGDKIAPAHIVDTLVSNKLTRVGRSDKSRIECRENTRAGIWLYFKHIVYCIPPRSNSPRTRIRAILDSYSSLSSITS